MELLELKTQVLKLFGVESVEKLGDALSSAVFNRDVALMERYVELVGDLTVDSLQPLYQYYLADRKEKKQDYTPPSIARLLSSLIGDSETCVDLCAGSGALTIQRWAARPEQKFELYEIDETVVPYLLFNLAVRNVEALVYVGDALAEEYSRAYRVERGEKYGTVVSLEPAL